MGGRLLAARAFIEYVYAGAMRMNNVTVIGAGAWGTALALTLCRSNGKGLIYSRNEEVVKNINHYQHNITYLPDVLLPSALRATSSLAEAMQAEALLIVVPSQFVQETCLALSACGLPKDVPVILCCKGIEKGTLRLTSEVAKNILPINPIAILSGPNFADEVAMGLPAATTIACEGELLGNRLVQLCGNATFRPYYSNDVIGTQIGGAVKNVLAIACGIVTGRGLGENAKAAIMTRGLAEMVRLGLAKGGKMETLMGLSGVGDLILTCSSSKSRNMSLGMALGKGKTLEDILSTRHTVTEGVVSAQSVTQLARKLHVEMPICEAVCNILHNGTNIDTAIQGLLQRPFTSEM